MGETADATVGITGLQDVGPLGWREVAKLIGRVDVLLLGMTAEGRVDYFNRAVEATTGYSSEELEGLSVDRILTATMESQTVPQEVGGLHQVRGPMQFECSLRTKGGDLRLVRFAGTVTQERSGTKHLLLVGTDTTPYRKALERLRRVSAALEQYERPCSPAATAKSDGDHVLRGTQIDRRRAARHHYPCEQKIAPIVGRRLPSRDAFRAVRCHDISPSGFSFLTRKPPGYRKLVAALGIPEAPIHVVAQVIHISPWEYDGKDGYRVGCRYIGRASYRLPADGWKSLDPTDSPLDELGR